MRNKGTRKNVREKKYGIKSTVKKVRGKKYAKKKVRKKSTWKKVRTKLRETRLRMRAFTPWGSLPVALSVMRSNTFLDYYYSTNCGENDVTEERNRGTMTSQKEKREDCHLTDVTSGHLTDVTSDALSITSVPVALPHRSSSNTNLSVPI